MASIVHYEISPVIKLLVGVRLLFRDNSYNYLSVITYLYMNDIELVEMIFFILIIVISYMYPTKQKYKKIK
jgi:hypothetical protein